MKVGRKDIKEKKGTKAEINAERGDRMKYVQQGRA